MYLPGFITGEKGKSLEGEGLHLLPGELIRALKDLLGSRNLLLEEEERVCYSYDATFRLHLPDAVVFPADDGELREILKLADRWLVPVVPRGGGTGLSGGAVPLSGGIVLSTSRLNAIREIDEKNFTACVEPGVITADLQAEVEARGLFYPPDPGSAAVSTLGGNLAEGAGGPRGVKYGVTRDYVLGLEVATAGGERLVTGGRTLKNVTGYDLTRLMVGSEGTLGVITLAYLHLLPLPPARQTIMAVFPRIEDAAAAVSAIMASGIIPAKLELMDRLTINCVESYLGLGLPKDAGAILLVELDGEAHGLRRLAESLAGKCRTLGASNLEIASNDTEAEVLWLARNAVSAALSRVKPTKISEDATVPRSRVPDLVRAIEEIADRYKLKIAVFGHAGDGNLHPNFLVDQEDPEEMRRMEQAAEELFRRALELGGTLSGEHGIGYLKAPYMLWEAGEVGMSFLRKVKDAFDPHGILNPMKIFPEKQGKDSKSAKHL